MESSGEGHRALLTGVHVPCGQSRSLYISSNVLGVSLHREGVRTVTFLSFACKSMSEARSLHEDNWWAEPVVSPCLNCHLTAECSTSMKTSEAGAGGSEQPTMCQANTKTRTSSTVMLGTCQLPQHPLTRGAAIIMCILPAFLRTTVQLQLGWDLEASHELHIC